MAFAINATKAGTDESRTMECATAHEAHCSLTEWLYDHFHVAAPNLEDPCIAAELDKFDHKIASAMVNLFREPFTHVAGGVVYSCVPVFHGC